MAAHEKASSGGELAEWINMEYAGELDLSRGGFFFRIEELDQPDDA